MLRYFDCVGVGSYPMKTTAAGGKSRLPWLVMGCLLAALACSLWMLRKHLPDAGTETLEQEPKGQEDHLAQQDQSQKSTEPTCEPEVISDCTAESQPEPPVTAPAPGERSRMPNFHGLEYQLFLPTTWRGESGQTFPVVVFLHGAGDGKFSVMNSQSLPRLLTRNQSTCFDPRHCWCLPSEYERATAKKEAPETSPDAFLDEEEDLRSPMAACDFAERFEAITVMPQGWSVGDPVGWTGERLSKVRLLTKHVLEKYHGDPARVSLTGQSAGGAGAWRFAAEYGELWSSVSVVCAPAPPQLAESLENLQIWVVGWTGDGEMGNDDLVEALKRRTSGSVRYTRYTKAPPPPDPQYRYMLGHGSYDLIYRDPRLWQWALAQRRPIAIKAWQQ